MERESLCLGLCRYGQKKERLDGILNYCTDDIVSETQVDIKVWDADKIKYDDMWGSVSMSVKDIVQGKLDKLGNVASWSQDERVVFDG